MFFIVRGRSPQRYWLLDAFTIPAGTIIEMSEVRVFTDGVDVTALCTYTGPEPDSPGAGMANWKDNDLNTREYWLTSPSTKYIKIDFGVADARIINGVKLGGWDNSDRYLTGLQLSYSDDDITYIPVGSKSGLTYPGNNTLSALITFP